MYPLIAVQWNTHVGVAGIIVEGHMPIMLSVCIPVTLVILLIGVSSYEAYILTQLPHI